MYSQNSSSEISLSDILLKRICPATPKFGLSTCVLFVKRTTSISGRFGLGPPTRAKGVLTVLHRTKDDGPLRAYLLQVVVLENHQNGRDSHIRQIDVFGPRTETNLATDALDHPSPELEMYSTVR